MPLPIGLGFLMLPMALPRASFLVLPMALDLAVREVVLVNMKTIKRLAISKNPIQDFVGIHVDSMHVDTSWCFSQCVRCALVFSCIHAASLQQGVASWQRRLRRV